MARSIILLGKFAALAEMTEEDQTSFCRWQANPELQDLIDDHHTPSTEDQMSWFQKTKQPDRRMLSIVTVPNHDLVGHGGFVDIDPQERTAQFRITIGNPDYWGKGLGTEATTLFLRYGFETMQLGSVWLRVFHWNARAVKCYERAGFRSAGEETLKELDGEKHVLRMVCSPF